MTRKHPSTPRSRDQVGRFAIEQDKVIANPSGLCQCGCGQATPLAKVTMRDRGHVAGQPQKFILGHYAKPRSDWRTKVEVDALTGCWNWTGPLDRGGYGQLPHRVDGTHRAHRAFYAERYGAIPAGLVIDHLCRNPRCVNPDHLEAVTNTENTRRGATAKLSAADVEAIRGEVNDTPQRDVAVKFGVTQQTVSKIARRQRWLS